MTLPTAKIIHGDCIEAMRDMPENSVDSIVTDPPYGLGFMGKKWDDLPPGREWAEECLRVLKPGGHLLAFGGTRTWHRLAVAVEDAGFEIRDSIAWLYGSGFPKSYDISKGIDKLDAATERLARARTFQGWLKQYLTPQQVNSATGTNMGHHLTTHPTQPAIATAAIFDMLRPILPAVPDYIEDLVDQRTVESENFKSREVLGQRRQRGSQNVTAAPFNSCKSAVELSTAPATDAAKQWEGWGTALKPAFEPVVMARKPLAGRTVAANVLEHGTGALNIDASRIAGEPIEIHRRTTNETVASSMAGKSTGSTGTGEYSTAGRWPANVILDENMADMLDEQSGVLKSGDVKPYEYSTDSEYRQLHSSGSTFDRKGDSGGASRFFYVAKAPKKERPVVNGVAHPTVKPLALMRYLVKLVTPAGGMVLEPFAGSGATVEACILEGFDCIAIERELEYLPLIEARIERNAAA